MLVFEVDGRKKILWTLHYGSRKDRVNHIGEAHGGIARQGWRILNVLLWSQKYLGTEFDFHGEVVVI